MKLQPHLLVLQVRPVVHQRRQEGLVPHGLLQQWEVFIQRAESQHHIVAGQREAVASVHVRQMCMWSLAVKSFNANSRPLKTLYCSHCIHVCSFATGVAASQQPSKAI
jgi:hypothetical protein